MICVSGKNYKQQLLLVSLLTTIINGLKHIFYVIRCEAINLAFKNTVDFARKIFDVLAPSHE